MIIQILLIVRLLKNISRDIQWIVALAFPLTKMINDYVLDKIISKVSLIDNIQEAKFMLSIVTNLVYSLGFAIAFTNATKATECILLGINACINISLCYRAIRLDRKVSTIDEETKKRQLLKEKIIAELILNETIEIIVPMAFIGSFLMAYYGPNKNILGNVGCTVWKFEKVAGLHSLIGVVEMALFDSGSVILVGGLLWMYCRINIFEEYCKTIKKYWIHVAFHGGSVLSAVSFLLNLPIRIFFLIRYDL